MQEGSQDPQEKEIALGNPMDRGAWQATLHGVARVRHNLATKQQQQNIFFRHPEGQSCTYLECTHHNLEVTARCCLMSTVPLHGHQRVTWFIFFPQTSILPIKETQALTAFLFLFFTIIIKYINTQAHFRTPSLVSLLYPSSMNLPLPHSYFSVNWKFNHSLEA